MTQNLETALGITGVEVSHLFYYIKKNICVFLIILPTVVISATEFNFRWLVLFNLILVCMYFMKFLLWNHFIILEVIYMNKTRDKYYWIEKLSWIIPANKYDLKIE